MLQDDPHSLFERDVLEKLNTLEQKLIYLEQMVQHLTQIPPGVNENPAQSVREANMTADELLEDQRAWYNRLFNVGMQHSEILTAINETIRMYPGSSVLDFHDATKS